jgi:hypothetical protein
MDIEFTSIGTYWFIDKGYIICYDNCSLKLDRNNHFCVEKELCKKIEWEIF